MNNPSLFPRLYLDLRTTVNGKRLNDFNLSNSLELTEWIQYQIDNNFINMDNPIDLNPELILENGLSKKSLDVNSVDYNTLQLGGTLIKNTSLTGSTFNFSIESNNLTLDSDADLLLKGTSNFKLQTPNVVATTATVNQILKLTNATTGLSEFTNLGSGLSNYLTKWNTTNTEISQSLLRDDGTTVSLGASPFAGTLFYVRGDKAEIGRFEQISTVNSALIGGRFINSGASIGVKYAGYFDSNGGGNGSQEIGVASVAGSTDLSALNLANLKVGVVGLAGNPNSNTGDSYGGIFAAVGNSSTDNYGIKIEVTNAGAGNSYAGRILDGNEAVGKIIACTNSDGRFEWKNEESIYGTATYNGTDTGSVVLDFATFSDTYRILTGNTTYTYTNTPATGYSIVRSMTVKSNAAETLTFGGSATTIGTYDTSGVENYVSIKATNFPTVGLKIVVYITQA
jgi:hypothetical protein